MYSLKEFVLRRKYIVGFLLLLIIIFYFWNENRLLKNNPAELQDREIANTVLKVSEILLLPEGEVPTLGTVSNVEQLKDQPFFKNAKVGYKVLIYTKAQKAILYDPERHLVIEVAPINLGDGSSDSSIEP